ncbi:MAG: 2-hydroxyacyl-CoA dehydratase, partial [Halanaerobiales bacterium]
GYYGEVQKEILKENGYQFEMFMLEPNLIYDYYQIRKIFGKISIKKIINAVKITWKKIKTIDIIHKLVLKRRATEKKQGQVDKLYNKFLKEIDKTMFIDNIDFLMKKYIEMLNDTRGSFKQGVEVKIGIVGEIYLVLEPFVNLDIENILGNLGASVEKKIYLTSWLEHFLHLSYEMVRIKSAAKKYLKNSVGGHGIDSIGNTVLFANRNFDGVIQLAPFTCMPEIVSQSIIPRVSRSENIPVLSLFYDEHTADAGLKTRLEAFVDLLIRKKEMKGSISCV